MGSSKALFYVLPAIGGAVVSGIIAVALLMFLPPELSSIVLAVLGPLAFVAACVLLGDRIFFAVYCCILKRYFIQESGAWLTQFIRARPRAVDATGRTKKESFETEDGQIIEVSSPTEKQPVIGGQGQAFTMDYISISPQITKPMEVSVIPGDSLKDEHGKVTGLKTAVEKIKTEIQDKAWGEMELEHIANEQQQQLNSMDKLVEIVKPLIFGVGCLCLGTVILCAGIVFLFRPACPA